MDTGGAKTVGLIGCGLIGEQVLRVLVAGEVPGWEIGPVLARTPRLVAGVDVVDDPDTFFRQPLDLIIEAAGPEALTSHGPRALRAADVWAVSGTALASDEVATDLEAAGGSSGHRLRLLPGAIAGLDGVMAITAGPKATVHLDVDLPPAGERDHTVFTGSVRQAAGEFPHHVNVAVATALAGLGLDRTTITVRQPAAGAPHTLRVTARSRDGEVVATSYPVVSRADNLHLVASAIVGALRAQRQTIWVG